MLSINNLEHPIWFHWIGYCSSDAVNESEFTRAIKGPIEVKLALRRLNLGDIDVEIADRVGLELLFVRLVALDIRQTAKAMALQAAMQG